MGSVPACTIPGCVAAHCGVDIIGWSIACVFAGTTAIEHVRDLWPMPPHTLHRCGLFLRDECPLTVGKSPPAIAATPATPRPPFFARCTMFFVPCEEAAGQDDGDGGAQGHPMDA